MSVDANPPGILQGWVPIIGAFLIWFGHFLLVYGAALIWPRQGLANGIALAATVPALVALAILFMRLRSAAPASGHTRFMKRFGLGSIFIATAGVLFDLAPALFA